MPAPAACGANHDGRRNRVAGVVAGLLVLSAVSACTAAAAVAPPGSVTPSGSAPSSSQSGTEPLVSLGPDAPEQADPHVRPLSKTTVKPSATAKKPSAAGKKPPAKAKKPKASASAMPKRPAEPMDARDLMEWVSNAEGVKRSVAFTVTTPDRTLTGVRTFIEHVGLEADVRAVGKWPNRFVIIDGTTYFRLDKPVKGKNWVKSDDVVATEASSLVPLGKELSFQVDPVRGWFWYKGAMPVTRGRRVTVEGVSVTPYSFRKNAQQLIADLPPKDDDPKESLLRSATAQVTYYVTDQGLPLKIVETVTSQGRRTVTTQVYRRWGQPVTVPVPPASDVTTTPPSS